MTDRFTEKRAIEIMRKAHLDESKIYVEIASEFGRRLRFAVKEAVPEDIAFEICVEHFKIMGKAMIEIAESVKFQDGKLDLK